jgi:hypothetical protein
MNATTETTVFKSKWGYHPCSKETALKLRTINRVYDKALRLRAAWDRWANKLEENRVQWRTVRDASGQKVGREKVLDGNGKTIPLPEPKRCPIFEWTFHWPGGGKRPHRISKVGEAILKASRLARTPVATPEEVQRPAYGYCDGSEEAVCRLYEQCRAWEEAQG